MNESVNQPPPAELVHQTHEVTDVNPIAIGLFASGLALVIALVLAFLGGLFGGWEEAAKRTDAPPSPFSDGPTIPSPQLQDQPALDLARFRQHENELLSTYGWIDQGQGVTRIPINRAITILAERGLPEPAAPMESAEPKEAKP